MTSSAAPITPGLPVKLGEIQKQLNLLWEQSDAGKSRASLINLVVYSEAADAITANTPRIAALAAEHAFRALLVQANPSAPLSNVNAWITAHCHIRAGKDEVCSEQITFRLDGSATNLFPSIIFSHLDTDLPIYLWWQGSLHEDPDPGFWNWVDRLIVDSITWENPARQFRLLFEIEAIGRGRCAVCDLTWTRLFYIRYAVAHIFDIPAARSRISELEHIKIRFAKGHRVTALQLLGWIASRLNWIIETDVHSEAVFRRPDGGYVSFQLVEDCTADTCLAINFTFKDATASVHREPEGNFYLIDFSADGHPPFSQMAPAGRERTGAILLSELSRSSRHPLYWPTIRAIEPLL